MKKTKLPLKIAVLSISLLMLAPSALSVALPDIAVAYPAVSQSLIDLTLTLPFALEIPFSFVGSYLSNVMKKKHLIALAVVLVLVGGIAPYFVSSFTLLLVLRGVLGAGVGIILPLASGLIPVYFEPDEFPKMFGAQAVVLNIGGMAFTQVAGWLAMSGWKNVFWIYSIGFIVLVLTALILPEPTIAHNGDGSEKKGGMKFDKGFVLYLVLAFLLGIGIYCAFTNTAAYIVAKGIGDSASIGTVLTMLSVGGLVLGFIFNKLFLKAGKYTAVIGALLFGGSYILLGFANSIAVCAIATFIMGVGGNVLSVLLSTLTPTKCESESVTAAMGILMACMFLGEFISPIVINGITGLLGIYSAQGKFLFTGSLVLVFMVISAVTQSKAKYSTDAKES